MMKKDLFLIKRQEVLEAVQSGSKVVYDEELDLLMQKTLKYLELFGYCQCPIDQSKRTIQFFYDGKGKSGYYVLPNGGSEMKDELKWVYKNPIYLS